MYRILSKISFALALSVCSTIASYAQSDLTPQMKQRMLQDMLAEKMHAANGVAEEGDISAMLRTTTTGKDKKVSTSTSTSIEEAETSIIVDPTDSSHLVLSFMSQSSTGLSFPIYYSSNGGATWLKSTFNTQTIATNDFPGGITAGGGDPVFAWDKASGKLYFAWIYLVLNSAHDTSYFTLNWAYSTNKGQTWIVPKNHFIGQGAVNPTTSAEYNYKDGVCDREWFAIDNSGGSSQGTLYCSFINFANGGESVRIKRPSDTAFDIAMHLAYDGASQLANIEVDKNGVLHMSFANISTNVVYHVSSSDSGITYTKPAHKIAQGSDLWGKANVVHDRENSAPSLAIDGDNNLHVAWGDFKAGKTYAYYSHSTDKGITWSTPKRLDSLSPVFMGKQMFMPTITASANNVTITVTAIDPVASGDSARVYQLTSSNYGQSFYAWPLLLSAAPTYYPHYVPMANYFFGDYNKSVSTTCMTYAIWEDGRLNQGPKVYMAATNQCVLGVQQVSSVTSSLQLEAVYPIPASDNVTLQLTEAQSETITVTIHDMSGKTVLQQQYDVHAGNQNIHIPLNLNNGIYALSIANAEGLIATRSLQVIK